MNRRTFVRSVAVAPLGLAWAAAPPDRVAPTVSARRARRTEPSGIEELTLQDLQAGMESGRFTSRSLTREYLDRLEALDRSGPALRSVIEVNPDALAIARERDRERRARGPRGPLHGIPVLLKDNIDTRDRLQTTAGSLALVGAVPARDATLVRRLREAGAVVLGKTNLSEWANFRSTRSTSGWSARGGLTRNPYCLDRNPSGSSSGSAVAAAANLCAVAVGTETDGSILSPSSYCGIVGLKPTVGLISRAGIIPISHSQDTAGPMARTVADAAALLGVLASEDPLDPATLTVGARRHADYTLFLNPNALRGARIGVVRKLFTPSTEANALVERALATIRHCGAEVVDPAELPSHGKLGDAEYQVMLYEFKAGLNAHLAGLGPEAPVHALEELIAFNERRRNEEMPLFGQEILLAAQEQGPLTEPAYLEALARCRRLMRDEGIDAVMNEHRLDALVAPTTGPAHMTDFVHGDRDTGGSTSPAAVAGYPSITVPAGLVKGLPVGVSFFGRAWSEERLIALAYAFEQATPARQPPRFRPTTG